MSNPLPDYGLSFVKKETDLKAQDYAKKFIELQIQDPNYSHQLVASQLWAIRKDESFYLLNVDPDVYDLLSEEYILTGYIGVIIHTTGWAAPLGKDGEVQGAPSKHALRRRIGLASCVTDDSIGSAISFSDDPEIVLDPGSATGSLAEALLRFWETNKID